MVARSAQKTKGTTVGHLDESPSHTLMSELRMVRCCHSTMPFALELYAEMRMCRMPYLSESQSSAATYAVPLSVTISPTAPHLHNISSKINAPRVRPVSMRSACHSGQAVSEHRA